MSQTLQSLVLLADAITKDPAVFQSAYLFVTVKAPRSLPALISVMSALLTFSQRPLRAARALAISNLSTDDATSASPPGSAEDVSCLKAQCHGQFWAHRQKLLWIDRNSSRLEQNATAYLRCNFWAMPQNNSSP